MAGRRWTIKEDNLLREKYANTLTQELADELGRGYSGVGTRAAFLGLKKDIEFIKEIRRNAILDNPELYKKGQFKKGLKPWNTGKKGLMLNSGETCFKPGHEPHNTLYDGAVRVRTDKDWQYKYVRVRRGKWKLMHRVVWEEANGKIPDGFIVVFKDGDTMNCDLSNLEMISREENMGRNTLHNYPKPIADVIRLTGVINRLTKNRLQNA